eukprot:5263789-Alexandrium_andersonii.AAC.1
MLWPQPARAQAHLQRGNLRAGGPARLGHPRPRIGARRSVLRPRPAGAHARLRSPWRALWAPRRL